MHATLQRFPLVSASLFSLKKKLLALFPQKQTARLLSLKKIFSSLSLILRKKMPPSEKNLLVKKSTPTLVHTSSPICGPHQHCAHTSSPVCDPHQRAPTLHLTLFFRAEEQKTLVTRRPTKTPTIALLRSAPTVALLRSAPLQLHSCGQPTKTPTIALARSAYSCTPAVSTPTVTVALLRQRSTKKNPYSCTRAVSTHCFNANIYKLAPSQSIFPPAIRS